MIALIDDFAEKGWEFNIIQPSNTDMTDYWEMAGWSGAIEGRVPHKSQTRETFTPLASYRDNDELNLRINKIMEVLVGVTDLSEGVLVAVEWAVNEIADNVLVHAGDVAGWLQVIGVPGQATVEIVVADRGAGILETMKEAFVDLADDAAALQKAIEPGATRNPAIGQGNGLAGSVRIAQAAKGWVNIFSGDANLRLFPDGEFKTLSSSRYRGTVVAITLPTNQPVDTAEVLWGIEPVSMFENSHLSSNGLRFKLREEAAAFGNRATGVELATKLRNLLTQFPEEPVLIDFDGIDMTSASFLDEFLAKMVLAEGEATFNSRFHLLNMSDFVRSTANAVTAQRLGHRKGPIAGSRP